MPLDGLFSLPPRPLNGVLGSGHTLRLKSIKMKDIHLHKEGLYGLVLIGLAGKEEALWILYL
ncbi:hypothetical protein HanOQP8_Chr02g0040711 [Helianthus annuus]|nr:hypothetical protein HanOQP8_Chr02g0040711 [Helianthus annuus]